MTETSEVLRGLFARLFEIEPSTITDETAITDHGDSLDAIELLMDVEEHFGIQLDEGEWEQCENFAAHVALIDRVKS